MSGGIPELPKLSKSQLIPYIESTLNYSGFGSLGSFPCPESPNGASRLSDYRKKQPFRVASGKSKWIQYETFNPSFNLREILDDEIVIEFDMPKTFEGGIKKFRDSVSFPAINFTAINLYQAGYTFEIWEHGGKSPHIHIHELPIKELDAVKRKKFKKVFIRRYVPKEYLGFADESLTGIHLIAIEWTPHWKGKYGTKVLLHKFEGRKE